MARSLTHMILQKIGEAGEVMLDGFFPSKYAHTHLSRLFLGLDVHSNVTPQTVSALLSRLKRQGLVERRGKKGSSSWMLTETGRQLIKKNGEEDIAMTPLPDGITRLVIFDIPERERGKRDLIRAELIGYNFRQLQRSVWIGQNPIPEDFIELLDTLQLKNCVHIFSVKEKGTIES